MGELKTASFKAKNQFTLPKGATITKNECRVSVSEIENGFIITKDYDIKWQDTKGESHYEYFSKQWYSPENPITVNEKLIPGKKKNILVAALDKDNNPETLE